MKKGILQIFIALSLAVNVNFADEVGESGGGLNLDDIQTYELGAVEISGAYEVDAHPETTSVSAKEIKDSGAQNLGQALRQTPGVLFREGTGSGNTQEIYIRGYSNNQIGVYMDGIPMMSIYGGGADYAQFATAGLAGVEVSKSFVDSSFGANSLGGAVNMISAKPEKEFEFSFYGTYIGSGAKKGVETRQGISVGTNQGKYYISVDYAKTKRDTYAFSKDYAKRAINTGLDGFDIAKGYAYNGHYENETFKLKLGVQPNENHEYSINYILSKGGKGGMLDFSEGGTSYAAYTDYPTKDTKTIYFLGTTFFTPELNLDSKLFYQKFGDRQASIDSTIGMQNSYRGTRYDDTMYGTILTFHYNFLEKSKLQFGANAKYSEHIGLDTLTPSDGNYPCCRFDETASVGELSSSLFAQYSQGLGKFRFILGASLDRMDTTHSRIYLNNSISGATGSNRVYQSNHYSIGSNYTLQGVLYYDFTQAQSVHINIGKKYRMPSLRERYSTDIYDFAPNPNLKPEGAINYEVGYDLNLPSTNLSVAVYYNDLTNIFDSGGTFKTNENCSYPDAQGYCNMIGNIPRGYSYGGEVAINQGFFKDNALTIGGSYSYIQKVAKNTPQVQNIVEPASNRKITQYPNHIAQGKITIKPTQKLEFIGLATYESAPLYAIRLLDRANNEVGYDFVRFRDNEFVNFDIKANYEVFKGLTMSAGIYNLTDRDNYVAKYGDTKAYEQPDENGIRRKTMYEYHYAGRRYFVGVEYRY